MEKGRKTGKRILSWLLAIVMILSLVSASGIQVQAAGSDESGDDKTVELMVAQSPKLEVALAVGNTKQDYSNFENELKTALIANNISSENISFVQVDANASSSQESFPWWRYDHSANSNIYDSTNYPYIENVNKATTQSNNEYNSKDYHIETENSGKTMKFYGYGSSPYKDFNFLPNEQATKKTIEFTITEGSAYDAFDGIGFLINASITGDYPSSQVINGYLLFMQYYGSTPEDKQGTGDQINLYKLTNVNASNLHNGTPALVSGDSGKIQKIAKLNVDYGNNKYRRFKIEVMPTYIKMWYTHSTTGLPGAFSENVTCNTWDDLSTSNTEAISEFPLTPGYDNGVYRGGFGPLSSYRSHNCTRLTMATLSNLSMTAEYVRSLTEVVREPSWSQDKISFLVNLNEEPIGDFSQDYTSAEIINRLEQENVTYIGWCGTNNVDASQVFVDGISRGSGLVNMNNQTAYGSDYTTAASRSKQIKAIADLIAAKVVKESGSSGVYTYLDTDDFHFTCSGAALTDGKWSVGYAADTFDNAKNSISNYSDLAGASFVLPGYYEIYYGGNTDNPKAKIRIHRAPKANFTSTIDSNGKIQITNKSYDPDKQSDSSLATGSSQDGIKSTEIEYRKITGATSETTWTQTAPDKVEENEIWMVRLTVTDEDGASDMLVQQVTKQSENSGSGGSGTSVSKAPFNAFTLSKSTYIKNIDDAVEVIDQSYSLDGQTFTVDYVLKGSTLENDVKLNFQPETTNTYALSGLSAGTYTITMTAKSSGGKESAATSRTFTVKEGFTVEYDANAGGDTVTGLPSIQYKIKDEQLTLSSVLPARSGYIFAGWATQNNGEVVYKKGDIYSENSNITLYAVWKLPIDYVADDYKKAYDGIGHNITVKVNKPASMETNNGKIMYKMQEVDSQTALDNLPDVISENEITSTSLEIKDAGWYKVYYKIQADGYLTIVGSKNVVISKADPVSVTLANKAYTSIPTGYCVIDEAVIKGVDGDNVTDGTVEYKYYLDKNCTTPTTTEHGAAGTGQAPKIKGIYYVKAFFKNHKNYKNAESNVACLCVLPDVYYYNTQNVRTYGTLEDVLAATDNNKKRIYIEGNMLIDESVEIPSGYTLFVEPDVEVTLSQGVTLTNNGTIRNSGTFNGDGKIINNKTFDGGIVSVPFINNGTVSYTDFKDSEHPEKEVPVTNNNTMNDCTGDDIKNGENGKVQIDGAVVTYEVTFEATANLEDKTLTSNPSKQTINWGDKITDEPVIEDIEGVAEFQGWYQEKECTNAWNFTKDTVNSDITLYAKWKEYATFEVYWVDQDGKKHYGTFENVLSQIKNLTDGTTCKELHIQKEVSITKDITVPDDVPVIIDEGATLKLKPDTTLDVPGGITNNGTIETEGEGVSKPVINGGEKGIQNNGSIDGVELSGDVKNNEDATITNSDINNNLDNSGTVEDSNVDGNVTNNTTGTLKNTTPKEDKDFINNGDYKDSDNQPVVYTVTYTVINGDQRTTSTESVQYGALAPFVRPDIAADSTLVFSGWYTDEDCTEGKEWNFKKDTVKKAENLYTKLLEASSFDACWSDPNDGKKTYGSLKQALSSESSSVTIQKSITIPTDSEIPSDMTVTVSEGVTLTVPEDATVTVNGKLINEGTITNNGTLAGKGTLTNNSVVKGGKIDTAVSNAGKISDSELTGTVNNEENGTIISSTLSGTVSNKGIITMSTLSGNVTNDGTISGGTLTETSKVTNNKTINGSEINGKVVNGENGKIVDNNLDGISYQVTFDTNGHGSDVPETKTIACGRKIEEPDTLTDANFVLTGWYTSQTCEPESKWDFANDTVSKSFTLYAGWIKNEDCEASWKNAAGETVYGTLEDAAKAANNKDVKDEIHVQNNAVLTQPASLPEGVILVVDEDKKLTLDEDSSLTAPSGITNKGTIEAASGEETAKKPVINGDVKNEQGASLKGLDIQGDLVNGGTVSDSEITGEVTNDKDATISDSDITGPLTNTGTVEKSNVKGDVTNNEGASITDSNIQADKVTNDGNLTKSTITGKDGDDSKAEVTNGKNGNITESKITGDTTNDGTITDSNIKGSVENNNTISGGRIEPKDEKDSVINSEDATISDTTISGPVDNNGTLTDTDLTDADVDSTDGTVKKTEAGNPVEITYEVTFNVGGYANTPASQNVGLGKKVTPPSGVAITDDKFTITGWYTDASYTKKWSFSKDLVYKATTLYAKFEEKASFEAYWTVTDGDYTETVYGSLEEALKSGSENVTIQKDITIPTGTVIPKDMTVTIPEDITVTIPKDATVTVNGKLDNQGTVENKGTIGGDGTVINHKTITGGKMDTSVDNSGKITDCTINGPVENEGKITDSTLNGTVDNDGTISDSTLSGDVTNDGTISGGTLTETSTVTNNKTINGSAINGKVVNGEDGKIVDDNLDGISYQVTFDTNGHGATVPERQTIVCGRKVKEPEVVKDTDYVFLAWYTDKACTEGKEWNFATDTVSATTVLYASWRAKNSYEAYWMNSDGEKEYGTLEEALKSESKEVHVQKDTSVEKQLAVPEGTTVTVDEGKTLTLGKDGGLDASKGNILNKGKITGSNEADTAQIAGPVTNEKGAELSNVNVEGDVENNGKITDSDITGNVRNGSDGKIESGSVTGDVDNAGTIKGSNITGTLNNAESGKVEDTDIAGNVKNDGSISGGNVDGDVENNGTITETAIKAENVTNNGNISGGSIEGPADSEKKANVTNGEKGEISDTDITGNVTNDGKITEGSTISGDTTNNGIISDATLDGNVTNKGTLENNDLTNADVDNTDGIVKGEDDVVTYEVIFVAGAHGTNPEKQSVEYGKKVSCPKDPTDDQYAFAGWYLEESFDNEFDFASPIKKDYTLYAKWVSKADTEAYWIMNGETKYGTLEQALNSGSQDIHITKSMELTDNIDVPEGVKLTVESGVEVSVKKGTKITLGKDAELLNNGKLDNNGTIAGDGKITNNKNITGGTVDTDVVNNGTLNSTELNGHVTNNKAINDCEINAGLNNSNGTVSENGDKVIFTDQQVKGTISKEIADSSEVLENATVKLVQGNKIVKQVTTKADGTYDLTEVPSGIYNVVIESVDGTVNTLLAEVGKDDIQISDITLPEGNLNNKVVVAKGTPNVVVGGLDKILTGADVTNDTSGITASDREKLTNGGSVEIRFEAELKESIPPAELDIEKVIKEDKKQIGMNLDLSVIKTVTTTEGDNSETKLKELDEPIMVNIPIAKELQGKENYVVYRFHDGNVDRITEKSGEEYIKVNQDATSVTLYTKKFSTYVLAYDIEKVEEQPPKDTTEQKPTTEEEKPDITANLSAEQKTTVKEFESNLGLSEKNAVALLQFAEKNNISKDTLLVTESTIFSQKNDNDIKGSSFARIQAKSDRITKTSIKLKWNKVSGADGYLIYGNKCGKGKKYQLIKTIKNGKATSFTQKKLKKGTYYKYLVRAYKIVDNQKVTIALSKTIHTTTLGGKYGVAKAVKTNKSTIKIKKNKKFTIKAREIRMDKKIKQHRKIAYESSNPVIATVSTKGVVKGVKKGSCFIYVYAQNGVFKKIKITVK